MDEWIQLIVFIIFGAIALITRMLNRRGSKEEPDTISEEDEVTLPPWGNVPMDEEALPDFIEVDEPQASAAPPPEVQVAPQPEPARTETMPPPYSASPPVTPTVAGIPLSPETFRQGIILAEILRPPKSIREPRQ